MNVRLSLFSRDDMYLQCCGKYLQWNREIL